MYDDLLLPSNGNKVFILNHTALCNGVNHGISVWGSPPRNRHPGTLLVAQMMEQEHENIRWTPLNAFSCVGVEKTLDLEMEDEFVFLHPSPAIIHHPRHTFHLLSHQFEV